MLEQYDALLEHEHLLGERIFACGRAIAALIAKLTDGKEPKLEQGKWNSPQKIDMVNDNANLRRAMAFFVHLIDHFADQVHLQAEEAMVSVAVACGMEPKDGEWVLNQHDQARAYWDCLNVAWRRVADGDDDDRWYALVDFRRTMEAFVFLFDAHAYRENYQFYPKTQEYIKDSNDALVLNIIQHSGPSDITPYIGMVGQMEALLGIPSPPQ
jgi:hemerythrin-like domain-containing protein